MISSSLVGWVRRFAFWRDGGRRFRIGNRSFYAYYFRGGRVFGVLRVNLQSKPNWPRIRIMIWIFWGAAVGAAAAELMDGAFDGPVQSRFLAAEAVQDPTRAGIAIGNAGEAASI